MSDLMTVEATEIATATENPVSLMESAKMLSNSTIIPVQFQRKPENCYIALDMANRMGVPVMMVMQNLYVVQGRPSWSGTAIASMVQNSGKFDDVELIYTGQEGTDSWGAYVTAKSKKSGKTLKGATVTIGTAKAEGWYAKSGSKWKTMPELMLCYRAYAWFARQHCPDLMMGLQSNDEIEDVTTRREVRNPYEG